jgi:hypothetical protein
MKRHNVFIDFLLTVCTVYLFTIWVQIRQIHDVNEALKQDKYSVTKWFLLSVITIGLYHCYHEYKMTKDLVYLTTGEKKSAEAWWAAFFTFWGLWVFVDLYHQSMLNQLVPKHA